jgi:hypothetical protein
MSIYDISIKDSTNPIDTIGTSSRTTGIIIVDGHGQTQIELIIIIITYSVVDLLFKVWIFFFMSLQLVFVRAKKSTAKTTA